MYFNEVALSRMVKSFVYKNKDLFVQPQYDILEDTPFLYGSDTLNDLYNNADNEDQKASIMMHIDNFDEITSNLDSYKKVRNKIWDDFI